MFQTVMEKKGNGIKKVIFKQQRCSFGSFVRFEYVIKVGSAVRLPAENWLTGKMILSLMSRIERRYCLISTSYLAGLFGIFIVLHI